MRWTEEEANRAGLRKGKDGEWYFPGDLQTGWKGRNKDELPKLECRVDRENKRQNAASKAVQAPSEGRYRIFVTSYRKRDCDPDNLCPKWFIDEIVRAGWIPDDSSKHVEAIEKRVIKRKGEPTTLIEVYKRFG